MIRKLKSGEYRLYSRKKDARTGRRKNLGTFRSRDAAEKHERAVQFFKRGWNRDSSALLAPSNVPGKKEPYSLELDDERDMVGASGMAKGAGAGYDRLGPSGV